MRIKISIVTLLMLCTRSSPGICNNNFIKSLTKINGKSYTFNQLYDTTNMHSNQFAGIYSEVVLKGFKDWPLCKRIKIQYHQTVAQ